jgi:hypothetical protein
MADVPSGLSLTATQETKKKKKIKVVYGTAVDHNGRAV